MRVRAPSPTGPTRATGGPVAGPRRRRRTCSGRPARSPRAGYCRTDGRHGGRPDRAGSRAGRGRGAGGRTTPDPRTGLIVDVLPPDGQWRYLEALPEPVLLTEADVTAAAPALAASRAVLVQLQQPSAAALPAARAARDAGALVVLDGAPADDDRREAILGTADVIRADD